MHPIISSMGIFRNDSEVRSVGTWSQLKMFPLGVPKLHFLCCLCTFCICPAIWILVVTHSLGTEWYLVSPLLMDEMNNILYKFCISNRRLKKDKYSNRKEYKLLLWLMNVWRIDAILTHAWPYIQKEKNY